MTATFDTSHLAHLPENVRNSRNSLFGFCPDGIPYQKKAIRLIRRDHDYSEANLEILLSGSIGSAKSAFVAHVAITHCLMYRRARVGICRRALPDLKETLFKEIIEHLEGDAEHGFDGLVEGRDYWVNTVRGKVVFKNGSEIIPAFWADRKYKRVRSLKLSMAIMEEAVENDDQDKQGFWELKGRIGRLPHVPENVLICATNPDSPAHWLYDYFIGEKAKEHPNRHVFYSRTEDNIYLPTIYIKGLRKDMDPRLARRLLDGEWIELTSDQVYYAYSADENYRPVSYDFDLSHPIRLSWDFNIGVGKPLSMVIFQYINDEFHWAQEIVIEGMRTADSLDELADRGILDLACPYFIINGDAAGKHKDTRNRRTDYDIIIDFLSNYRTKDGRQIRFEYQVPLSNPTLRSRHNAVNAYCLNKEGRRRFFVYKDCPTLHKGMRLVELRKGSDYQEDDSKDYQHITTAAGYGLKAVELWANVSKQGSREL